MNFKRPTHQTQHVFKSVVNFVVVEHILGEKFDSEVLNFALTESFLVIVGFKVSKVHILETWLIYFIMHIEPLVGFLCVTCFNKVILSPPPSGWNWFSGLYNLNYLHKLFFNQTFKHSSLWQRKK